MRYSSLAVVIAVTVSVGALQVRPAEAGYFYPTSAAASSAYSTYPASEATDNGTNKFITDWASNSQGAGTYLDMTFAAAEHFSSVFLTDRTTSGGPNNVFSGGLFDYTTKFSIQAYADATFSTPVGPDEIFTKAAPSSTLSVSDFQIIESLSGLTGQYLRYTVLASNGANPGLADIEFAVVPEPASIALLGLGFAGLMFRRRAKGG